VKVPEVPIQRNDSMVPMEESGQLYAYRANSNSVYLGTRTAHELGAAIGIGSIANGTYICIAENRNESANVTLDVAVESKPWHC
jgi:hypothetical protein